ncbi:MAG: AraC family transcriptional regulator [Tissierellia bacterium]|nr:AraC family transcriptional regulator [Tissierellia bacterium]
MTDYKEAHEPMSISAKLDELRNIKVDIASSFEFYYLVDGKATLNCKGKYTALNIGDMFMAIPGQAFMLIPDHEPSLYINLTIDQSFIRNSKPFQNKYLPCITKEKDIRQAQLNTLYRIYEEIFRDNHSQVIELTQLFLEKLPWSEKSDIEELNSSKKTDLIIEASHIFEKEEPGLEDLAKALDISPSYLSRVFKEVSGVRFSDYSQRKKLERAAQLLLTDMSIEEIALEIGFTSSKSLNRIFRQFVSTTPSNYRKFITRLANKNTDQEDLRFKCGYQNFSARYAEPSYSNTMTEYLGSNYNKHRVSLNTESFIEPALGLHGISLNNLGENYLDEIKNTQIITRNNILVINIRIQEGNFDRIYLCDLNRWASAQELFGLLEILKDKSSTPILSVELMDKSIHEFCNMHQREELTNYIKVLEEFYKHLIKTMGRSLVEDYYFTFDTSYILKLSSQKSITYFFEFMEKRHIMMEKVLFTVNYNSVYNLGKLNTDDLEKVIDFISKNRHRIRLPSSSYVRLKVPQQIHLNEPHQLLGALKTYREAIEQLNRFETDERLRKTKIELQGIEINMDLDFVDPLYFDLFFSILCLDLWMNLKGKSRIIPHYDFHFNCRTKTSVFTSILISPDGFPTTFYHISNFISQMPSEVIYHKEGCMVSKKGDDIHMIIYTNPFLDYSFSLEKGFDKLNRYNREINIELEGLNGTYKEKTQIISRYNGSPYYMLRNFSNPELMNDEEKAYLRSQSVPELRVDYKNIQDKIKINVKMTPFEVIYKVFTKVEDPV